jgi:hypothetical protein
MIAGGPDTHLFIVGKFTTEKSLHSPPGGQRKFAGPIGWRGSALETVSCLNSTPVLSIAGFIFPLSG